LSRPGRAKMRVSQRIADSREKFLPIERLLEQTEVTWPVGRRSILQVGATGNQDRWQPGPCRLNRSNEFKTVHNRHADVRDQAVNLAEAATREQRGRRREQPHDIARGFQQTFERSENSRIIVDHGNDGSARVVGRAHARILSDGCPAVCNRKM